MCLLPLASDSVRISLFSPTGWAAALWWGLFVLLIDPRTLTRFPVIRSVSSFVPGRGARFAITAAALVVWRLAGGSLGAVILPAGAVLLGLFLRALLRAAVKSDRRTGPELARWCVVLGGSLLLIHPYLTSRLVGAGDAEHYARSVADFVTQLRSGTFPVWIGQSITGLHGAIHPLRVAPYFQYAAGILDLATGQRLSPIALQNLLIVGSFLGAAFSTYAALTKTAGAQRWGACWLTLLFISSPGVLALIYAGDMVASWMALPWLSWLFLGWVKAWREPESSTGLVIQAAALALLWLSHAPIAVWASLLTTGSELARWAARRFRRDVLLRQIGAAFLCLLLCQYVFVSVVNLNVPTNPYLEFELARGAVFDSIAHAWQGVWRSVSANGNDLARDLHLGPGLLALGAAAVIASRWTGAVSRVLAFSGAMLFLSLVPWPGVTDRFWSAMPAFLMTVSEKWPAQRFYPILSALIPMAAALTLPLARSPRSRHIVAFVLGLAALASGWEARKFVLHGYAVTRSEADSRRFLLPENNTLSRYSYEMWGYLPDHFSFGYMDPEHQNRIINPTTGQVLVSNLRSVQRATSSNSPQRFTSTPAGAKLPEPVFLPPHQAVCLHFSFSQPELQGTLVLTGTRLSRRYEFPRSGGPYAFGPHPGQGKKITLRNDGDQPEQVHVEFFNTRLAPVSSFATVEILPIESQQLPVRLKSLTPFRLELNLEMPGWLETPKLFFPEYQVSIDGHRVGTARSPNGLLMFPVPAGNSTVSVAYIPPASMVGSFWLTLAAWVAFGATALGCTFASCRRSEWFTVGPFSTLIRRLGVSGLALGGVCSVWAALQIDLGREAQNATISNSAPIALRVVFPVGTHEVYEPLLSWRDARGATTTVVAFYENDRYVRLGCRKNGVLKILTDSLPVSYFVEHSIVVSFSGQSPRKLQLTFNGQPLWETECEQTTLGDWTFAVGRSLEVNPPPSDRFRGRISTWAK
jgi:hypothetical protein